MIGEILDFTQSSTQTAVLGAVNYGDYVRQLTDELKVETALKSVALSVEGPLPDTPVLLDPKRLRRVFYNLMHNATDAMPGGAGSSCGRSPTPARSSPRLRTPDRGLLRK